MWLKVFMHKIIICEDHEVVVEGVKLMLAHQNEFTLCAFVKTEQELLQMIKSENPSIILLDLNLKHDDGFSILQKLKLEYPGLKVIILTMYDEPYLIEKAQRLKANGYLLKNMTNGELIAALNQAIESDEFYLTAHLSKQRADNKKYRDEFVGKMHLTPREIEIIKLIAQGKSAKEMADELFLSLHTIDTHRRNILDKLNLKNIADLTRFAFENHLL